MPIESIQRWREDNPGEQAGPRNPMQMISHEIARNAISIDSLVREYMDAIRPMMAAKIAIYSRMIPTIIIHPDGRVEHRYDFTPEQQKTLQLVSESIDAVKTRIFGA